MKYLTFLFLILIANTSFSQKMIIKVNPSSTKLYLDCIPVGNPKKVNLKTPSMGIIGVKEGYITQGYSFRDLAKKNSETFTFELKRILPLPEGYISKSIEFKKITDATGKVEKPDRPGLYGYTIKGTKLNSPLFIHSVCQSFTEFGYKMINADNMFEDAEKSEKAELIIIADLKYFSKGTIGVGFQISLIVEWSIYSVSEKKVIQKINTAGYSDKKEKKFNNELSSALGDALLGLLNNADFQKIAQKN